MSAANFAPYSPSPDERQRAMLANSSSSSTPAPVRSPVGSGSRPGERGDMTSPIGRDTRSSLDLDYDPRYATESYQSSAPLSNGSTQQPGRPAWAQEGGKGNGVTSIASSYQRTTPAWGPNSSAGLGRPDPTTFSTAQGWSMSNLCFAAWALPPFTSVLLLIYETENDLVRFHAYQGGLFGVGTTVFLWILRAWFGWYTLSIIALMAALGYSWVCGANAANAAPTLARSPFLPVLGPLADQWVGEE